MSRRDFSEWVDGALVTSNGTCIAWTPRVGSGLRGFAACVLRDSKDVVLAIALTQTQARKRCEEAIYAAD